MAVLLPEHQYLNSIIKRVEDVSGPYRTIQQKAAYLGLPLDRICATYVYQSKYKTYLAVIPGNKKVNIRTLEGTIRKYLTQQKERRVKVGLTKAKQLPYGMTRGSCGPFPSDKDNIKYIIYDIPNALQEMEFVIPGKRDFSFQVPFYKIIPIVNKRYPHMILPGKCYDD